MAGTGSKTTKAAIHSAALPLFVEHGFDATTMSGIAEAADISRRSLYRYFDDKESVFFDYHERETEVLEELLAAAAPHELPSALRSFALLLTADPDVLGLRVQVLMKTPHLIGRALQRRADWERRVAEALARSAGLDAPTLEMKILGSVGMGALYVAVRDVVYDQSAIEETLDRALAFIAPLVPPPPSPT